MSSLLFFALVCLVPPGRAQEAPKKDDGGKIKRGAGKIVEAGESAGKEFERDASQAGREVLEQVKEASHGAAEEVRRATREFWRDVLGEKERLLAKLQQDNRELRARQAK